MRSTCDLSSFRRRKNINSNSALSRTSYYVIFNHSALVNSSLGRTAYAELIRKQINRNIMDHLRDLVYATPTKHSLRVLIAAAAYALWRFRSPISILMSHYYNLLRDIKNLCVIIFYSQCRRTHYSYLYGYYFKRLYQLCRRIPRMGNFKILKSQCSKFKNLVGQRAE